MYIHTHVYTRTHVYKHIIHTLVFYVHTYIDSLHVDIRVYVHSMQHATREVEADINDARAAAVLRDDDEALASSQGQEVIVVSDGDDDGARASSHGQEVIAESGRDDDGARASSQGQEVSASSHGQEVIAESDRDDDGALASSQGQEQRQDASRSPSHWRPPQSPSTPPRSPWGSQSSRAGSRPRSRSPRSRSSGRSRAPSPSREGSPGGGGGGKHRRDGLPCRELSVVT